MSRHHFYNIARKAAKIYVRGSDTSRFVQSMMTRSIIDIEDYTSEGFTDMQRRLKNEQVCISHGCMDNPYKKSYCALKRAHVLREWFYSLLPEESRKKLPEKSSDLFFDAIENLIWNRRSRIRFGIGGRDEVDGASGAEYERAEEAREEDEHESDSESTGGSESENDRSVRG